MATQSDLDKMRKKLSDLDAKLKSMRGNSPQKNPNFDSAMANQNYANFMRDQQARLAAQQAARPIIPNEQANQQAARRLMADQQARLAAQGGNFTQGRLMGAPTGQLGGQFSSMTADQRKIFDNVMARDRVDSAANEPEMTPEQYAEGNKFMEANIARIIAQNPNAKEFLPKPMGSIQGMGKAQQEAIRQFQYNQFITKSREGSRANNQLPPAPIPQSPQMATYNNLLQQGIQSSNTMNQDAASNFANMQAGAPTTQPAVPATANPAIPVAGMGMQQPRQAPAPRKFSTFNTPSSRIG